MKKLISGLLFFFVWSAQAQNFEGTIKWSMQMEFADPTMKAKMEEAMKAMPGAAGMMMPTGFNIKIKGSNVITSMQGGPMQMEMLYLKDQDKSFAINRNDKTYSVLPGGQGKTPGGTPPKVTKTSETKKILGYNCTKYLVETSERGRAITTSMWATTEIKDMDWKALAKQRVGRGQSLMYDGVEGIPLRIEAAAPEGSMVMEVTEIKKESLSASDFTVPADYKETQMQGMPGMH